MRSLPVATASVVLTMFVSPATWGQMRDMVANRLVDVLARGETAEAFESHSEMTALLGDWQSSLDAAAVEPFAGSPITARAGASQSSTITPGLVTFDGSASGGVFVTGCGGCGAADAESRLELSFSLNAPSDFSLIGEGFAGAPGLPVDELVFVRLMRLEVSQNVEIFRHEMNGFQTPETQMFEASGTLDPGDYNYLILSRVNAFGGGGGSTSGMVSFSVVPAPGTVLVGVGVLALRAPRRRRR